MNIKSDRSIRACSDDGKRGKRRDESGRAFILKIAALVAQGWLQSPLFGMQRHCEQHGHSGFRGAQRHRAHVRELPV